jgi:hypothetical protein
MTLWRLILAVIALTYAGFGFAFLFNPDGLGTTVSIAFSAPQGRTDFRAMYGGLEFGVGVFLLLCAFRREFVRIGLFASACILIAMATARSTGMLLDGFSLLQLFIVVTEWIGGAVATWGALVATPERDSVPTPLQDPSPDKPAAA